ncbi:MAG: hypothetical protein EXR47_00935 [Dehalococcoidia bacterium]|nr:hypothetical protein [Dehalococcoidia bacterium]
MVSGIGEDYFLLCFLSSMGVLQIAAAYGRLHGLLLLRARVPSAALGLLLVLAGFFWFFLPGPRLVSDTDGGLDGNQQSLYFALSAGAALAVTLLLSSLVNRRRFSGRGVGSGLDALRQATYLQAVRGSLAGLLGSRPRARRVDRTESSSLPS